MPTPAPDAAAQTAERYLTAWRAGDFAAMYQMVAPADRERYPEEQFAALHAQLRDLPRMTLLSTDTREPELASLPPEPRPPDLPAPTAVPTAAPAGTAPLATDGAAPPATASAVPPVEGPVLAMAVPVELSLITDLFGTIELDRRIVMSQGATGWQVRWTPASLFEELGAAGTLSLARQLPRRGRILAADGTVLAQTRDDGVRVYPQDWLAGQTIGYVSAVTAEDLIELAREGYQAGDVVGRSGLEAGAEQLLRGAAGFTLSAVPSGGEPEVVAETAAVPGSDVITTLQPAIQREAEASIARYPGAATAVVDPASGDVWALASAPALNPNAFSLRTTTAGVALAAPGYGQIANKAVLGTYPAGSSFKPFTLAAALKTGSAGAGSRVTCPPTWVFQGFTFVNYERHSLPGLVSLADAMAFSCNTTYMPLSIDVYNADRNALPDTVRSFGFGAPTGIRYLAEEDGILPDAAYFRRAEGREYGPFDQIQLSIGQGSFLGTPLQLATAYAAFGNGGTVWRPRLVSRVVLPDGTERASHEPEARGRVDLTAAQLGYVVETMRAVVERPYGTAYGAFLGFGVPVAGKSGTAETGTPNPDSWFAAIAPANAPTVSVATVLVREPLSTGGANAAPLVRRVMAAHFGR